MLAALHLATTSLIFARLVNALLAAVVTHVPLSAFGSQTGVGGVPPVPGGVYVVVVFLEQLMAMTKKSNALRLNGIMRSNRFM